MLPWPVDPDWSTVIGLSAVVLVTVNLVYLYWSAVYIQCLVRLTDNWRRKKSVLLDVPASGLYLDTKQELCSSRTRGRRYGFPGLQVQCIDVYDDINFMCVNGAEKSYIHVQITRKCDRKSYVKFTLCVKGVYTYSLPSQVVTYNNSKNSFSSAGLTITVLEEGTRLKVSYSGPISQTRNGATPQDENTECKQVEILLLWKNLSGKIKSAYNEGTQRSLVDYLSKAYEDGKVTAGEILDVATQTHSPDETTVQSGLLHGFIQIPGEDKVHLILRGFRRRSTGALKEVDGGASLIEQVLVSKNGDYRYIRLSKGTEKGLTAAELRKLCAIRMRPNGELESADLRLIYPYVSGWTYNDPVTTTDRHGTQSTTTAKADVNTAHKYILTDSQIGNRCCLLIPLIVQHKHPGISSVDDGAGLILYTDVNVQAASTESVYVDHIPLKDVLCYHPSKSLPLLSTQSTLMEEMSVDDKLVVGLDHPDCKNDRLVGGKGSQLAVLYQSDILKQCGLPIAACLTVKAFKLHLNTQPLLEILHRLQQAAGADHSKVQELCDQMKVKFLSTEMSTKTSEALQLHLQHIEHFNENTSLAVRSSAIGEDGAELSAAGQMETILGVKGYDNIIKAVKKCWASHFNFLAVQYRKQHGQPICTGMGVVIQEMVHADVAGALFTNDPVTGNCATMVINANYGVGESVVSGESEPDTFRIRYTCDEDGEAAFTVDEKHMGSKQVQYLVTESGDVNKQSTNHSQVFCMDDSLIISLCEIGLNLERRFGHPCDIEWAISQGQIYLLQSRPITTLNTESEYEILHEFDTALVMDSELISTMNIGEALPGALCPLTLSVVVKNVDEAMEGWFASNGLNRVPNLLRLTKICCNNVFINVHAYEINNRYRNLVADRRIMELNLAGHKIDSMTDEVIKNYHPPVSFLRRVYNAYRFFGSMWGKVDRCRAHEQLLDKMAVPQTDCCITMMSYIDDTIDMIHQVCEDYMPATGVSGSFSQVIMGVLTKGKHVWETKHHSDLALLLGCQLGEVLSVGVPNRLEELASLISSHSDLADTFLNIPSVKGHDLLIADDTPDDVRGAYHLFMETFGHRGLLELDLMRKCWSQDPTEVIETLQIMVRNSTTEHNIHPTSRSLEQIVNSLQTELKGGEKIFIKFMLPTVKRAVNSREIAKSILVKSVSKAKLGFWKLSELMHKQGYLPSPHLVFFLTYSELKEVIKTRNGRLINRAKRRQRAYAKMETIKFPRFNEGYPEPLAVIDGTRSLEVETELKGMPVSVGEVTGIARVVKSLSDAHTIQKNDIMIVHFTDIGWAPYFPIVTGVVTEQGGLVSHGAVVAREYGIPCVASCQGATQVFNSSDVIYLNGTTGVVRRLKEEELEADG